MLLTASTLWLLSITNEIFSPSVKVQLQWLRIEWLCWSIVPTLLIIYGLLYNEWVNRFKWWQLLLISTVPIAVFSLYLTHDRHGLIYENF